MTDPTNDEFSPPEEIRFLVAVKEPVGWAVVCLEYDFIFETVDLRVLRTTLSGLALEIGQKLNSLEKASIFPVRRTPLPQLISIFENTETQLLFTRVPQVINGSIPLNIKLLEAGVRDAHQLNSGEIVE